MNECVGRAAPIAVLGMHRSGTSTLAGSLEEAGLHLGEVVTVAPHNPRGNRENLAIRALNDRLLEHNGGRWDRPPASITWNDDFRMQRAAIIDTQAAAGRWGFKDPRTLLTLAFWQEGIRDLALVGTFRHPHAVATSLAHRDGLPIDQALALWAAYNQRLLAARERQVFPLISFDLPGPQYCARLASITAGLELPCQPQFFSEALRHHGSEVEAKLPPDIAELYQRLWSRAGGDG
jgi:hypothetical protein